MNWSLLLLVSCVLLPGQQQPEGTRTSEVGVWGGILATHSREDFHQFELSWSSRLAAVWGGASGWHVDARLNGSAGVLLGAGKTGAVVSLGPGLALSQGPGRWAVYLGISPTLLTEERFGRVDLGRPLQFTSHLGLSLRLSETVTGAYRFQHMSNGTLEGPNPGIDLHMFGLKISY